MAQEKKKRLLMSDFDLENPESSDSSGSGGVKRKTEGESGMEKPEKKLKTKEDMHLPWTIATNDEDKMIIGVHGNLDMDNNMPWIAKTLQQCVDAASDLTAALQTHTGVRRRMLDFHLIKFPAKTPVHAIFVRPDSSYMDLNIHNCFAITNRKGSSTKFTGIHKSGRHLLYYPDEFVIHQETKTVVLAASYLPKFSKKLADWGLPDASSDFWLSPSAKDADVQRHLAAGKLERRVIPLRVIDDSKSKAYKLEIEVQYLPPQKVAEEYQRQVAEQLLLLHPLYKRFEALKVSMNITEGQLGAGPRRLIASYISSKYRQ